MKQNLRKSAIVLCSTVLVVVTAYSVLSAAALSPEPLAAFSENWTSASTCPMDACANPPASVGNAWTDAVRAVLNQVESMETRLDAASEELDRIEQKRDEVEMAETLALDAKSPGRALETLMTRFKNMVETYENLDPTSKTEIADLNSVEKVEILGEVASKEKTLVDYFDRLAERRRNYEQAQWEKELADFEARTAQRVQARAEAEALEIAREVQKEASMALEPVAGPEPFCESEIEIEPAFAPPKCAKAGPETQDPKPPVQETE
jgi:hypothetical protein